MLKTKLKRRTFYLDLQLNIKAVPVRFLQTRYKFCMSNKYFLVKAYVDNTLYIDSGASSIEDFVSTALSDKEYCCYQFKFSLTSFARAVSLIHLLDKLNMHGIFHCIINADRNNIVYVYIVNKKEENKSDYK